MKVHLAFPVLPPVLDGIGDYTARLAEALAGHCQVKVLAGPGAFDAIPGVPVEQSFSVQRPRESAAFVRAVKRDAPDWLIVQYNPFSYGRWGFNPYLPLAIKSIKQQAPRVRIALMVHEPFVPLESVRWAVMTTWQRTQLWMLARTADLVFFSIEPWARKFRRWFPLKPVHHLPVGSNFSRVNISREEARRRIGVDQNTLLVGIFGSADPFRLLHFIRDATEALAAAFEKVRVLYIGLHGVRIRETLDGMPVMDTGALPPEAVSEHFAAMDIYLAPFNKGVSSRRGSFMVGIQHGLATVSTSGVETDAMIAARDGTAFLLAPDEDSEAFTRLVLGLAGDAERRAHLGRAGQGFFEATFTWDHIARAALETLEGHGARVRREGAPSR